MIKNNDEIRQLSTKEQCRMKLPIFFGSRDNVYHPFKEVIGNSIDEITNNFDNGQVNITLSEEGDMLTIRDSGRGMPLTNGNGSDNAKLLFQTLFAGTKYGESTTVGTNGVGNTVICQTSLEFICCVFSKKTIEVLTYENGDLKKRDVISNDTNTEHGTEISFILDPTVYTNPIMKADVIEDLIKRYSAVANKIEFNFMGKKYHYDNLKDYYVELVTTKTSKDIILENIEYKSMYQPQEGAELCEERNNITLYLSTSSDVSQETFLNRTYLENGGSINEGVVSGVRTFANKYCKDNKLFPKGVTNFKTEDIANSISFVCSILSNNVEYENQTKLSTQKNTYRTQVSKHTIDAMKFFELENSKEMKKFIDHLLTVQKHNTLNEKRKQELKKVLNEKTTKLSERPKKLTDCKIKGEKAELYIAEGDSAKGALELARNSQFQAITAVRGKVKNPIKDDLDKVVNSDAIKNIINILGCGWEINDKRFKDLSNFNIKDLKYGKIIIGSDADSDGYQIRQLVLAVLWRVAKTLVLEGRIYFANTPLYEIKYSNDTFEYLYDETEMEKRRPTLPKGAVVNRSKGLGQVEPSVLYETAMNPKTRNLTQVIVEDEQDFEEMLLNWLDDDSDIRKEMIQAQASNFMEEI